MTTQEIINLLSAIGASSFITAIISAIMERKKKNAEADGIFTGSAKTMLEEQRKEIDRANENFRISNENYKTVQELLKKSTERSDNFEKEIKQLRLEIDEFKQEKKYKAVFDSVADPIIVIETDSGNIIDVNESCIFDYDYSTKEEMIGLSIYNFFENKELIKIAIQKRLSSIGRTFQKRKSNMLFPISINLSHFIEKDKRYSLLILNKLDEEILLKEIMGRLKKYLKTIQDDYKADWVIVWEFHNGEYDVKGVPITRISPIMNISSNELDNTFQGCENIPTSIVYDSAFALIKESVLVFDPNDDKVPMSKLIRSKMKEANISIGYVSGIYDMDGKIMGVLSLGYKDMILLEAEKLNEISNLANRTDYFVEKHLDLTHKVRLDK